MDGFSAPHILSSSERQTKMIPVIPLIDSTWLNDSVSNLLYSDTLSGETPADGIQRAVNSTPRCSQVSQFGSFLVVGIEVFTRRLLGRLHSE